MPGLIKEGNTIKKVGVGGPYQPSTLDLENRKAEKDLTNVLDQTVADKVENIVGELVKTTGTEIIKKDDSWIKNQVTAWAVIDKDGTILESYNINSVVKLDVGQYDIHFKNSLNNNNYAVAVTVFAPGSHWEINTGWQFNQIDSFSVYIHSDSSYFDEKFSVIVIGGK